MGFQREFGEDFHALAQTVDGRQQIIAALETRVEKLGLEMSLLDAQLQQAYKDVSKKDADVTSVKEKVRTLYSQQARAEEDKKQADAGVRDARHNLECAQASVTEERANKRYIDRLV